MPTFKYGDMWSAWEAADLFLITTNSYIKKNGALVMGRGIARQARDRFVGLDVALGRSIEHLSEYYLLVSKDWPRKKLGAFQVKRHYKDKADVELIERATWSLINWMRGKDVQVHLNCPGVGNGGLGVKEVGSIIARLPDNVYVWRRKHEAY